MFFVLNQRNGVDQVQRFWGGLSMDILGILCIMFAAGADPEKALADMFDRPEAVSFGVGVFKLPRTFRCRFLDDL